MQVIGKSAGGTYLVEMNQADFVFLGKIAAAFAPPQGASVAVEPKAAPVAARQVREYRKKLEPVPSAVSVKRAAPAATMRACAVCGKAFAARTCAKTCGPTCAKAREAQQNAARATKPAGDDPRRGAPTGGGGPAGQG